MADNFHKLWVQKQLNQNAINRAADAMQKLGKNLPCTVTAVSGSIVTVSFDVDTSPWTLPEITIPKAESSWMRMPTQVGDKGYTVAADCFIGHVSGLGSGTPALLQPGNLASLVFVPISNSGSPPVDQNAAQIQGPNGAIIRTTQGTVSEIVTDQSGTTITFGTTVFTIGASSITMTVGGFTMTMTSGGLSINGTDFFTHKHSGVTTGSGDTGGVV